LKKLLINKEYKFNIIVEPFKDITYEQIQSAANVLQIPLEEHVFIPELNTWTKEKVPVGVTYIQSLEHYGKDYLSLRSTGKYKSITKQPVKGKKNIGGQSIGNLDVYALLAHDKPKMLNELMTLRSDDFTNKYKVISDIVYKGYSELPEPSSSVSYDLFNIFLNSIGIDVIS
jgi:DNA-directed RNA polymerase beta subunit